jgi:hypothetical protein
MVFSDFGLKNLRLSSVKGLDLKGLWRISATAIIDTYQKNIKKEEKMKSQIKSNRTKVLVFVSLIAIVLIGAVGATSVAAKSAIPGDALYSLKTTVEQTQLSFSKDAAYRTQLKIKIAEERLEEISKLVQEGRYLEIKQTVLAFESAINGALFELEDVSKSDPVRAADLASEITASLSRYAEVLTVLAASVPEVIQAEVNRALDSALLAGSLDMHSDDYDDDYDDVNSNDDDYDDDMNSNDDDDDNMNSNDDDYDDDMNSNDDDDDNMNSNDDDYDDDMNSNDDDYDDDMNSNDDDDDDDMNSNDDDDDNMNSNDDDYDDDDDRDDNDNDNYNDDNDDDDDDDDNEDNEDD